MGACAGTPQAPPTSDDTPSAKTLFERANKLFHDFLLTVDAKTVEEAVAAEDRITTGQGAVLFELAVRGIALAQQDIARHPGDAQHHLLLALHLTIESLGQSQLKSLVQGRAKQIPNAFNESIRLDRTLAGAGALRLRGKFYLSAPWPFHDIKRAEKSLREAIAIASVPQAHVFLGDLLWKRGNKEEAAAEWRRAIAAPSAATTRYVDPQLRELARRRLRLAGLAPKKG